MGHITSQICEVSAPYKILGPILQVPSEMFRVPTKVSLEVVLQLQSEKFQDI